MNLCGGGRLAGSTMTLPTSNPTRKTSDAASDQFPAGLRVLVVDDDPTCLKILERMLHSCRYEVTKSDRAEYALNELRRNKNGFDIVMSDVHMPDMDGFKLLEHIGLEMDLPVIMMSADDSKDVVMKGVVHGACDYLIKPIRMEALKNIWQHVVRKKKNGGKDIEHSGSYDDGDSRVQKPDDVEYSSSSMNDGNLKSSKRKIEDDESEDRDENGSVKKPRVVWSVELHQQFVVAVNQLGIDKAVPKKILELMNVPGLTRENVASHLQKYRLYLRRLSGVSHHQGILSSPFMSPQDTSFGTMSPLDLQTLAVAGQLRGPTLSGYQPGLSRPAMPFIDQRNPFSLENPKLRFPEGQNMHQLNTNNASKQINLLHGIPTTMELKQVSGFHHHLPQTNSGQMMNERNLGTQISPIHLPMRQNISSPGSLPRAGMVENNRAMPYSSAPQASSTVDFTSKGMIPAELNSNFKGPSGFGPKYDMFNQTPQQRAQDWQRPSLSYGAPQTASSHTNTIDLTSSAMLNNRSFSPSQKTGLNGNSFCGNTSTPISAGLEVLHQGSSSQNVNTNNSSSRVKPEMVQELNSGNNLYSCQYADDDLMGAFLKQQEGIGTVEGEFDFDGYTLDNIPV